MSGFNRLSALTYPSLLLSLQRKSSKLGTLLGPQQLDKCGMQGDLSWAHKIVYSSYLQQFQHRPGYYKNRLRENALKDSITAVERLGKSLMRPPATWRYLDEEEYKRNVQVEVEVERNSELLLPSPPQCSEDEATTPVEAYGTADPTIPSSNVPCGGCGAYLHCQDSGVPGYLPSERFKSFEHRLNGELCLRCFCLKNYNTALNVNVSPDEYPKVMGNIDKHFAMVLLLVDLTDFPCSIWPGIIDVIGTKRPVFLVGNKVDLIPRDSDQYLRRIREGLYKVARDAGLSSAKIIHTTLISATTGYGIEDLITSIHNLWKNSGDIFIMGCTNVGKSSLFNALVQSDLCKAKVADLIQKATISQWPGTTLNLLKFPLVRPEPSIIARRLTRLNAEAPLAHQENMDRIRLLRKTRDSKYSILSGKVGRSFLSPDTMKEINDPFVKSDPFLYHKYPPKMIPRPGEWDSKDPSVQGNWCYDTPGAVNENQMLDILTLPELSKLLPKQILKPRTFFIHLGMSFFVGGLARIDYIDGLSPIRYTVFCSEQIPITMVKHEDAEDFYEQALGSPVLGIPEGSQERLLKFPTLKPTEFMVHGDGHDHSCADIVLSSAGWVAVTVGTGKSAKLTVHTPAGKGMFLRQPAILPFHVNLKGPRIRGSFAYLPHRVYIPKNVFK